MGLRWPWRKRNNGATNKKEPKSVNVFLGFFYIVNFCVGTGFLGIPYAFFYSGFLAAIPTLLFMAVINWINANYLLEVMARAQGLEYLDKAQRCDSETDTTDSETDQQKLTSSFDGTVIKEHPRFEITLKRKFEVSELCEIFYNKYIKYIYLALLSVNGFLSAWSFTTVAGSAWATNVPLNFGSVRMCEQDSFAHRVLPEDGCLNAYYLSIAAFAIIVISLSILDLKEQVIVQVGLGLLRFFTIGIIVLYCIVRLIQGGDSCDNELGITNTTVHINVDMKHTVFKFDPKGWVLSIPVFAFAFLFHTGLSSLSHPIKQKGYLHWVVLTMFLSSTLCYLSLGIVVPLWFGAAIQETATLNWAVFTRPGNAIALRVLSYFLILFPSLDVVSAYPLQIHVVVNNLYILITGHDTSKKPKFRFDWLLRIFLRFVVALLPILAAFGVANLIYVLKFGGMVSFIGLFFPFMLQLKSIYVCKKRFSRFHISVSGSHSPTKQDSGDEGGNDVKMELKKNGGEISPSLDTKKESLLLAAKDMKGKEGQVLYMTPYSNFIISHPWFGWGVGVVGFCLFVIAFSSLFVHPSRITCQMLEERLNETYYG